jgi:hypothetical protein
MVLVHYPDNFLYLSSEDCALSQTGSFSPFNSARTWSSTVQGRTLFLNGKNSELCGLMYPAAAVKGA